MKGTLLALLVIGMLATLTYGQFPPGGPRPGGGPPMPGQPGGFPPGGRQPNQPGFQPPMPGMPDPGMPNQGPPVLIKIWKCSKCGAQLGTGEIKPTLSRCPHCGVRLGDGTGWVGPGIGIAVVVIAVIIGLI